MFQMSDLQVVDPHIYRNVQALRYISAAGLVMLLYDHLLCFDDEVALIWKARWTIPKTFSIYIDYSAHRNSTTLKVLNKFLYKCELSTFHCALRLRSVSTSPAQWDLACRIE
ncbi:hypothetical protein WG66_014733 [Moniliophthora roreri]|nr:hypothetical protein WG66_014733 [Moniliophthora roreri]